MRSLDGLDLTGRRKCPAEPRQRTHFAHTAPVWIGSRLSPEPTARRAAVADLRRAMANAEQRLDAGYTGTEIPNLKAHSSAARTRLEALAR